MADAPAFWTALRDTDKKKWAKTLNDIVNDANRSGIKGKFLLGEHDDSLIWDTLGNSTLREVFDANDAMRRELEEAKDELKQIKADLEAKGKELEELRSPSAAPKASIAREDGEVTYEINGSARKLYDVVSRNMFYFMSILPPKRDDRRMQIRLRSDDPSAFRPRVLQSVRAFWVDLITKKVYAGRDNEEVSSITFVQYSTRDRLRQTKADRPYFRFNADPPRESASYLPEHMEGKLVDFDGMEALATKIGSTQLQKPVRVRLSLYFMDSASWFSQAELAEDGIDYIVGVVAKKPYEFLPDSVSYEEISAFYAMHQQLLDEARRRENAQHGHPDDDDVPRDVLRVMQGAKH